MDNSTKEIKSKTRPKIGIVVGSGGIKAMASIGLFEFLEKAKIDVDLLIGCSGGSIFAGWWATGKSASFMKENVQALWTRELFAKVDYRTLLSIAGLPFGRFDISRGLIKTDLVHKNYQKMYGNKKGMLPHSEDLLDHNICLPMHAGITVDDAKFIINKLLTNVKSLISM